MSESKAWKVFSEKEDIVLNINHYSSAPKFSSRQSYNLRLIIAMSTNLINQKKLPLSVAERAIYKINYQQVSYTFPF